MVATAATAAARLIREWEQEQRVELNAGRPSLLVARGAAVTLTRMDLPALRAWSWMTDEWEGRTYGDLRGYTMASTDGTDLGIILSRGHHTHAEWLNPTTSDYEFAGQVRTLKIAANYIMDRHDALTRAAGLPARVQDDEAVLDQLITEWTATWLRPESEPVALGTEVVYDGTLTAHRGEIFILQSHDHMYDVTDLDDNCWCDPRNHFTLIGEGGHRALTHVHREHFTPAA